MAPTHGKEPTFSASHGRWGAEGRRDCPPASPLLPTLPNCLPSGQAYRLVYTYFQFTRKEILLAIIPTIYWIQEDIINIQQIIVMSASESKSENILLFFHLFILAYDI